MASTRFRDASWQLRRRGLLVPILLLTLDARLEAQSGGVLVGTPTTVYVGAGTSSTGGPLSASQLHRKKAGFLPFGASAAVDAPGDPVFTASAMFGGGMGPPDFEVDAISLGMDVVPATIPAAGVSMVSFVGVGGGWAALAYSVTPGSIGAPGSLIEQEKLSSGGAAADLFTILLEGSDIPPELLSKYPVDVPQRALDALEMDIVPSPTPDITSADLMMQLYQAGSTVAPAEPMPVMFFSISADTASLAPAAWFDCGLPSGATILKTRWIPNLAEPMGGHWTEPRVHLSYEHLGLDVNDDVDALAVDRVLGLVLFSIVATPTSTLDEQLQVASWPLGTMTCAGMTGLVQVGIYKQPDSLTADGDVISVASRMGLQSTDDIDTVCDIDPGSQTASFPKGFGTPVAKGGFYNDLSIGVFRDDDDPAGPTITLTAANLPPSAPGKVIEAYMLAPIFLPIFLLPLDGLGGASTFELPLSSPVLIDPLLSGINPAFIWVVRTVGVPGKVTSPVVAIEL